MSSNGHRVSRRDLLRTACGTLAAGTAVGLAGCLDSITGGGGGDPFAGSLVAHWPFDGVDGDTAADASGNGNDATVDGATATTGRAGDALLFDGEDDVVRTPVRYDQLGDGLTVEAWARHDDLSGGWGWIFTQTEGADQWSQMGVHSGGSGRLRFELVVGEGTTATVDAPEGSIEEGTWHHWVGTWARGEGLRLYVDAELVASSAGEACQRGCEAGNTAGLGAKHEINVGAQGREREYWQGAIDEARIYDRALTAEEVGQRYDATA